jgi:hypothetical protein
MIRTNPGNFRFSKIGACDIICSTFRTPHTKLKEAPRIKFEKLLKPIKISIVPTATDPILVMVLASVEPT